MEEAEPIAVVICAAVLPRFVELAKERLGSPIRLYTFQANNGARRFYERHGFTPIAFGDGPLLLPSEKGNERNHVSIFGFRTWRAIRAASRT